MTAYPCAFVTNYRNTTSTDPPWTRTENAFFINVEENKNYTKHLETTRIWVRRYIWTRYVCSLKIKYRHPACFYPIVSVSGCTSYTHVLLHNMLCYNRWHTMCKSKFNPAVIWQPGRMTYEWREHEKHISTVRSWRSLTRRDVSLRWDEILYDIEFMQW